jgi:hypothetical protein
MTPKLAAALVKAGLEDGMEIELVSDYSGRGMFGNSTAAVDCGNERTLRRAIAYVAANCEPGSDDAEEVIEEAGNLRTDSLGNGIVVY